MIYGVRAEPRTRAALRTLLRWSAFATLLLLTHCGRCDTLRARQDTDAGTSSRAMRKRTCPPAPASSSSSASSKVAKKSASTAARAGPSNTPGRPNGKSRAEPGGAPPPPPPGGVPAPGGGPAAADDRFTPKPGDDAFGGWRKRVFVAQLKVQIVNLDREVEFADVIGPTMRALNWTRPSDTAAMLKPFKKATQNIRREAHSFMPVGFRSAYMLLVPGLVHRTVSHRPRTPHLS